MKRKRNLGLGIKISSISSIIIIVLMVLSGILLYNTAKNATEEGISNFNMDIASNVAEHIDPETYKEFLNNKTENDAYWEIREQLNDFREKTGALYICTLEINEDNEVVRLIDGQPEGSEYASPIGEISVTPYEIVSPVFEGKTSSSDIVQDPEYGDFLSAFAPIKDENGEVIGILTVDTNAENIGSIADNVVVSILPIFLIIMIVFMIVAGLLLFIYTLRSLRPLNQIKQTAENVADGDLLKASEEIENLPIDRKDEVGELSLGFKNMIQQLESIIRGVSNNSEHVAASAEELSANAEQSLETNKQIEQAVQEVAAGSNNQLSSSEESSLGMEEIAKGVQNIADSASSVADNSSQALTEAEQGKQAIDKVLTQMESIGNSTDNIAHIIDRLEGHSQGIVQILDVITDIAEQTNLLALNAAIEAARAGEYGQGFAVVSEEIRQLADQSKHSAEQIAELINNIHSDTNHAVEAMESGREETKSGLIIAKEADQAFEQILRGIKQVADQIMEVSASSQEMSASSEQVTALIEEMANVAKLAADNSENVAAITKGQLESMGEISDASNDLSQIAQELQDTVRQFKL